MKHKSLVILIALSLSGCATTAYRVNDAAVTSEPNGDRRALWLSLGAVGLGAALSNRSDSAPIPPYSCVNNVCSYR